MVSGTRPTSETTVLGPHEVQHLRRLMRQHSLRYEDLQSALEILDEMPRHSVLSRHERTVLEGIGVQSAGGSVAVPVLAGRLSRRELEAACLTTAEAADQIGVDTSRIRQRLAQRSLLGFHRAGGRHEWLLPSFQFELGLDDLPGLWGRLLRALPNPDATSPTALVSWLTQPREHLDGQSRVQALAEGFDIDQLVAEATTFGMPA